MRKLDVYFEKQKTGELVQDDSGHLCFQYADEWLGSADAFPLSYSLPLQSEPFKQKQCGSFFSGVLPEGHKRKLIANILGISAKNDFAMLKEIGRDCAGAIIFLEHGESIDSQKYHYRELDEAKLVTLIQQLPRKPLLIGESELRLSLAGAQDKMALHLQGETMSLPLGGAPSTHILKPAIDEYEDIVLNEALCMQLAAKVGLNVAETIVKSAGEIDYLCVSRFDRYKNNDDEIVRLHQEDFCQALNVPSEMKYQKEGGPSLKACFNLIRKISSKPVEDLLQLLDVSIFNFLIGNHDAHGKNFSILYRSNGEVILAPFYDLVCTGVYPELSRKMAMKIGGEYKSHEIRLRHFEKLSMEAELAKPLVIKRVKDLAGLLIDCTTDIESNHVVIEKMISMIRQRCEHLRQVGPCPN